MMVLRGATCANGRGEPRLNAGPAIGVAHLRLVQNLKEDALGIAIGIVRGQLAPQHSQLIHRVVAGAQLLLVAVLGMQIDLDCQSIGEHRVHGAIETAYKVRIQSIGSARILLQRNRHRC